RGRALVSSRVRKLCQDPWLPHICPGFQSFRIEASIGWTILTGSRERVLRFLLRQALLQVPFALLLEALRVVLISSRPRVGAGRPSWPRCTHPNPSFPKPFHGRSGSRLVAMFSAFHFSLSLV